ncbi:MAG TPA: tetratricopeptide repeat protein [Terriglobales bacterium]|jgi:hypothetical protein|nr:tetratricopeptide repeat protein [Terriglobales bacterium]
MKTLKILIVVIAIFAVVALISERLVRVLLEARFGGVKSAAFLSRVADKVKQKKGVPTMVDEDTEAFDVSGQEGMLVYYFRLVKVNASKFDGPRFAARVKQVLVDRDCSDPDVNDLLKQGVVVRYSYFDKFDVPIGSIDVKSDDCDAGHDLSATDKVRWKPAETQNAQRDAKPDSPWQSETPSQTASPTPTAKPHPSVETPEAKAQALVADGNEQLQRGNYDAAIKDFQAALALEPNNYAARSGLQEARHVR